MQTRPYFYALKARRTNPGDLGPFIDSFAHELLELGYATQSIEKHVHSIAHFGEWIQIKPIVFSDIDDDVIACFATHRCICPSRSVRKPISDREIGRIHRFVESLRRQAVLPALTETAVESDAESVRAFGDWLCHCRGLSAASVYSLKRAITKLLPFLGNDPRDYDVATVRHVIHTVATTCGKSEAKALCNALRSYLRFLAASGLCASVLVDAVPTIPHWRLASLPRYITATDMERVINVWVDSDHRSVRNRAIILLLARLGLRARDIVTLCINDIDWHEATVHVLGKSRRPARLPLPQDVGDAVLVYLKSARPPVATPEVFLRLRAPYGPLCSSAAISGIVDSTLTLADIENPPTRGANLLRHSAATAMLRDGATLEEVSTVLRHRSIDMSAHYAKVDVAQLQKLAQPWPENKSC